ncbi:MAG: hypothetical protein WC767_02370 [Candidatus Paceibacterota bacterium]|jgi:hypothetical protein
MIKKFSVTIAHKTIPLAKGDYADQLGLVAHAAGFIIRYCAAGSYAEKGYLDECLKEEVANTAIADLSSLPGRAIARELDRAHRVTAFIELRRIGIPYVGLWCEWFDVAGNRIMSMTMDRDLGIYVILFVKG